MATIGLRHLGRGRNFMIIKPRVRGFICVTAHPVGCEANVKEQIDYVTEHGAINDGPKKVLVLGASTGYGLAARISAAFGCGADTLGVFFEKEGEEGKLSSAGWYNSAAFEKFCRRKRPVRQEHQWRRVFRRDQAPDHRNHQERPGQDRPGRLQPGRATPHRSQDR